MDFGQAKGLRDIGVKKGDRVGVFLGNVWEGAVTSNALVCFFFFLLLPSFTSPLFTLPGVPFDPSPLTFYPFSFPYSPSLRWSIRNRMNGPGEKMLT